MVHHYMGIHRPAMMGLFGGAWWALSVDPGRDGRDARPLEGKDSEKVKKAGGPDPAGSECVKGKVYYLADYRERNPWDDR